MSVNNVTTSKGGEAPPGPGVTFTAPDSATSYTATDLPNHRGQSYAVGSTIFPSFPSPSPMGTPHGGNQSLGRPYPHPTVTNPSTQPSLGDHPPHPTAGPYTPGSSFQPNPMGISMLPSPISGSGNSSSDPGVILSQGRNSYQGALRMFRYRLTHDEVVAREQDSISRLARARQIFREYAENVLPTLLENAALN